MGRDEWEEIRLEADICENSVVMFLQAAIRPNLLDDILHHYPQPKSYNEWKVTILKADQNQRNSATTHSFHSSSGNNSFRCNSYTNVPFCLHVHPSTTPNPLLGQSESKNHPSPSSSSQSATATPKPKNCWKCGNMNHISRNCPQNAPYAKVCALYNHVDELDAAYEAASSGAENIRRMLDSEEDVRDDPDCRTILERLLSEHLVFVECNEWLLRPRCLLLM